MDGHVGKLLFLFYFEVIGVTNCHRYIKHILIFLSFNISQVTDSLEEGQKNQSEVQTSCFTIEVARGHR